MRTLGIPRSQRNLRKHTPRPAIGIHHGLLNQCISTQLGQQNRPDKIIDGTRTK